MVLCLLAYNRFEVTHFTKSEFMPYGIEGVFSALSTTVIFSYLGFENAHTLRRSQNPVIPIACIGSLHTAWFYMFMQSVFIGADNSMITNGWANISYPYDEGPFAGLAIALGLHYLATLIYIDAVLSHRCWTSIHCHNISPHACYEQNSFLPKSFASINQNGVPKNVIVNALVGILLLAPFEDWVALVKFRSVAIILAYAVGPVALVLFGIYQIVQAFKLPYVNVMSN